jgi:hypothetical protein
MDENIEKIRADNVLDSHTNVRVYSEDTIGSGRRNGS